MVAFSGIYVKNYDPKVSYEIFAVVLLGVVSALTLAKIIIVIVKSIKDPIHYNPSLSEKSRSFKA